MRFASLFLFALCLALPAHAAPLKTGPEVIDSTAPEKPAESKNVRGTLRQGCGPWEGARSVGIELENHVGAVIYVTLDDIKKKKGFTFKAHAENLNDGGAVLYSCDEKDSKCTQPNGTVTISDIKGEDYSGNIKIDGGDSVNFTAKRMPMKAECIS
jgi:hypothetical protein